MATGLVGRADAGDRVAPVRELFSHVGEMRKLYVAFVASGRIHEFHDLTRAHFTRGIATRWGSLPERQADSPAASRAGATRLAELGVACWRGVIDGGCDDPSCEWTSYSTPWCGRRWASSRCRG